MFARIIENLVVFEGVNPNRVYLMGYSAGGDGVFQLAPRMADHFAAASMMAGHPNETSPLGLRNLPFAIYMGGRDAAYSRNKKAEQWKQMLGDLRKKDAKGYQHQVTIYPNKGHWMDRQDASAIPWMAKCARNTGPEKVVWKQDDVTHGRFYWLAADAKNRGGRAQVVVSRDGQTVDIESATVKKLSILCNDRLFDLEKPVIVKQGDKTLFSGKVKRSIGVIAMRLAERPDKSFGFTGQITVELP